MRLKISKKQFEKSGLMGGKKYRYSLNVMTEMSDEETQVLNKYGYLNERFIIDPEISASIQVKKEVKGPYEISVDELQEGIEWSCDYLPVYFTNIPTVVHSQVQRLLGVALAREEWGGEEILET